MGAGPHDVAVCQESLTIPAISPLLHLGEDIAIRGHSLMDGGNELFVDRRLGPGVVLERNPEGLDDS